MKVPKLFLALLLLFPVTEALAQTGKISGRVTDASTGESLPGVNVLIDETTQGTVTDLDGFYTIINVRPGTYDLQASFVGYTTQITSGVQVSTNLTTEINFELDEQTVGLDEVTVTAEKPIVQLDVSANVANLTTEDFEDLPVAGVDEVLDLQAGVEDGLRVRGGGLNELGFMVDGMNMRTGRDNDPFTNISYTSVQEVQVQTGGFNAEYGNVRSGVINVATKEPSRTRYSFDGLFRFQPAQPKSFGGLPEDEDGFFFRPLFDPEVAMEGTGQWDPYTQRQYNGFSGWIAQAETRQAQGFDVTPEDVMAIQRYQYRKDNEIVDPDYVADFTVGGPLIPVPELSRKLGDLRFLASYRGSQSAYIFPQRRPTYDEQTLQLKLTSNIARGMRFTVQGFTASERGMNRNPSLHRVEIDRATPPSLPWSGSGSTLYNLTTDDATTRAQQFFSADAANLANVDHQMIGADFVHTLNDKTFYEVAFQAVNSKYRSPFADLRGDTYVTEDGTFITDVYTLNGEVLKDHPSIVCYGGETDITGDGELKPYCTAEEPFGYSGQGSNLFSQASAGGHWNKTRDTSEVQVYTGRFDLTSQVNRLMQIKTGVELIFSDYDTRNYRVNLELVGPNAPETMLPWKATPIQGAAYAQTKLEFNGMIANLGVRADYFDPNTDWWDFSTFDPVLRGTQAALNENLERVSPDAQLTLSPRLGLSFPITVNSKIYFNYGHFRQMLRAYEVFGIEETFAGGINVLGNPEHPFPKTVAYELGFDQNIANQYLLRISGFYRDIKNQNRAVSFVGLGDVVVYQQQQPWNYEDVRGAEFTITKNRGRWFRGFLNYTYLQTKDGNFGFGTFYENSFDQQTYLQTSTDYRLNAPVAEPFARMSLTLQTPADFGPQTGAGQTLLGNWRLNLLGEWRDGQKLVWDGQNLTTGRSGSFPELQENVSWRDFWMFDLRVSKHFPTQFGTAQIFLDIDNVFNLRHLYRSSAFGATQNDELNYLRSLHLPGDLYDDLNQETTPYLWIQGDDQPGDFRKPGTTFQPIEVVANLAAASDPNNVAWYYDHSQGTYHRRNGDAWEAVPGDEVDKVLDDRAYIDMPNFTFSTFLNPRMFIFGVRLTF